jgi:hypothetical protein
MNHSALGVQPNLSARELAGPQGEASLGACGPVPHEDARRPIGLALMLGRFVWAARPGRAVRGRALGAKPGLLQEGRKRRLHRQRLDWRRRGAPAPGLRGAATGAAGWRQGAVLPMLEVLARPQAIWANPAVARALGARLSRVVGPVTRSRVGGSVRGPRRLGLPRAWCDAAAEGPTPAGRCSACRGLVDARRGWVSTRRGEVRSEGLLPRAIGPPGGGALCRGCRRVG